MSPPHRHPSPRPHIIAWADLIALPWRNGGGVTRQILSTRLAASGDGASVQKDAAANDEDWDWRLSIADVDSAGAFSPFTGMTRILTVIEGESITLTVDGAVEELERHRPFRFDGDADTSAQLPHGPIRDLNLIARTGTVNADVRIVALPSESPLPVADGQVCVLLAGHAQLCAEDDAGAAGVTEAANAGLHPFDTVVGTSSPTLTIKGDGVLAVVTVTAAR